MSGKAEYVCGSLEEMGQIFSAIAGAPGSSFELVMSRWASATSGNLVPSQSGTTFLSSTTHSPPQRRVYERSPQEFSLTNFIPYSTLIAFSRLCYLFRYDPHNCVVLLETSACWRMEVPATSTIVWPHWGPARGAGARLHGSCWLKQSIVKSAMCYASKLCHRVKRSFLNSLERTILPSLLRRCTAIVTPTAATQHYLK